MSLTHPIFEIQEVVAEILSWMEPYKTAQTALVNRTWFLASVPYLWNSVLLSIALSPLGNFNLRHGAYHFVKPPNKQQRARFRVYSKHVRVLQGSSLETPLLRTAMARFRVDNVQNLFPNLLLLRWAKGTTEEFGDINALISPSVENFRLELPVLSASSFQPICHHLTSQVKALRFLQIHILSQLEIDTECIQLFHQLLKTFEMTLTCIQFPGSFYNEEAIERLRGIPNLGYLRIETHDQMWVEDIPLSWALSDGQGDFDVLQRLSFGGSQGDLCDLFLNRLTFSTLVELTWDTCRELDDADSFVTIIVRSCPQLGSLTVGQSQTYLHGRRPPTGVHWTTIRPLLGCRNLSNLSLHCCGVWMTPDDLIELLTSRQAQQPWKVLEIFHVIPLRISDLSLYAKHCPELERLGVHVNGYVIDYILPPSDNPANDDGFDDDLVELHPLPRHKFSKLAAIDFAFSQFHWRTAFKVSSIILGISEIPTVAEGWEWEYWTDVSTYVASRWWSGEGSEMGGWIGSRRSSLSVDETEESATGEARAPLFW